MTTFNDLFKRGGPVIGMYVSSPDPETLELIKEAGFDFVRLDYEHVLFSYSELRELIRVATLLDLPCQVRVSNLHDITKLLDIGATGIVVPDVNTVERAKEAVMCTKYYPLGARGMFAVGRNMPLNGCETFTDYVKIANDVVTLTVQVEDVNSAQFLDEIASIEGIDMLASGKADISQSAGIPGQTGDPRVVEMERLIIKKAVEHGKDVSILAQNRKSIDELSQLGVRVFIVGPDSIIIKNAFKTLAKELKG